MKKVLMPFLALLAAACLGAIPFLCAHPNILPEVSAAYYEQRAQDKALNASGPEAELMRLLLNTSALPAAQEKPIYPTFSWFGLVLALGAAAGLALLFLLRRSLPELRPALIWTGILAVPLGLIGARLVYCLVNLSFYVRDVAAPEAMLKVWEGGLSLSGGLVFITLAGMIGAKIGKAPVGRVLHALIPAMFCIIIAAAAAVRTADMGYGPEMAESLLTVSINGTPRLDTGFLLIVALSLVMLTATLCMQRNAWPPAQRFTLYAFLYGAVMILLESLRRDGHMVWGFVHAEMIFDLCFALIALLALARTKGRILLSLLATAVLAGAVVALEFALDRSAVGDGLLYLLYAAVIGAYLFCGWNTSPSPS